MKKAGIIGMGFWAPETVRRNDAWSAEFVRNFREHRASRRDKDFTDFERPPEKRPYEELFVKYAQPHDDDPFKGAVERRVKDPTTPISHGDATAGARALEDAAVDPLEIDLVFSSATLQDKLQPTNAGAIQDMLRCKNAAPLGVEAYCGSLPAQIDIAVALVQSGRAKKVLCVTSCQTSPVNDLSTPHSPIFGDGAGAVVIGEVPDDRGLIAVHRGGDGSLRDSIAYEFSSDPKAVWWRDISSPVRLGTDDLPRAKEVARKLISFPVDTVKALLASANVSPDAVDVLALIQPLVWFPPAVADGVGLPPDRVPCTYPTYGHIGGAAIVANLLEARRRRFLRDGSMVAIYGHGAGFTSYATLLRWHTKG